MESHRIRELSPDAPDPYAGMTIPEMMEAEGFAEIILDEWRVNDDGSVTYGSEGTMTGLPAKLTPEWALKLKTPINARIWPNFHLGGKTEGMALFVDGEWRDVFWRTPLERDVERVRWLAEHDREQREEFVEQKAELDAAYESLPDPLKARIDRFRAKDPSFRVQSEGYEMFCCTEGAKFYERAIKFRDHPTDPANIEINLFFSHEDRAKNEKVWDVEQPADPAEAWLLWVWSLEDYKRQKVLLRSDDGHSGNTFGGAMSLALALIRGQDC